MKRLSAVAGHLQAIARRVGKGRSRGVGQRLNRRFHVHDLRLEPLEDRTLLSASAIGAPANLLNGALPSFGDQALLSATASCTHTTPRLISSSSLRAALTSAGHNLASPATSIYYNPSQILTAYGINSIPGYSTGTGNGTGETVAIVDAYEDPNIASELAYFDSYFSLPTASLTVVQQAGVTYNSNWAGEIALDVEWVHAIAPGAKIVLVEAANNSTSDLMAAVATASSYSGVSVVSMSWGGSESSSETSSDSYFQVAGVTFVASTGDTGSPGEYPAYSPDVIAAGGTTLTINSSTSAYVSEAGWSESGGGTSSYESDPSYQLSVQSNQTPITVHHTSQYHRTTPDVSFDADPNTGVLVYMLSEDGSSGAWYSVGGTSVAAPCWSGIIAIINQLRGNAGLPVLNASSPTQALSLLYSLDASDPSAFHDVSTSPQISNGSYSTKVGYDEVTGIGSPVANLLTTYMVQSVPTGAPTLISSYDTGTSSSDDITYYNNSNSSNVLGFTVTGTISGATVAVYANGTAIGSATATGTSTVVTTSGNYTLADGTYAITAAQTESGKAVSSASSALALTIDTQHPAVTINQAAGQADPTATSPINFTVIFSEAVSDFATGDVTLGGTAGATTAVVTGSGTTYNVAVSGMTASGTATAGIAAGVAHDVAGNANVASTSTDNTVTYAPGLITVVGTMINDGNVQRSMVDSLTVTFSGVVNLDTGAFDVEKTGTGGGPVALAIATQVVGGKTVATVTFSGSLTQYGSLMDGSYELTVYGTRVQDAATGQDLDGGDIGQAGSNYVFGSQAADHFFRLFGDYNGDGVVNGADLAQFETAYLNPSGYQWYFDFNNDGHIDALDFYQFKLRYSA